MIYCVEDDRNIRELILYALESNGFSAVGFEHGLELEKSLTTQELPELILLDVMLPYEDGIAILKKLKKHNSYKEIPVILLTAKNSEFDKVMGLDLGADDYITKPFSVLELIARVKAVLRRNKKMETEIRFQDLVILPEQYMVSVAGEELTLTRKEYDLLYYLIQNQGRVLSREQLLSAIWGYDFEGESRTVDVHVRTLRQKLGKYEGVVETVRGVGYRFKEPK